MAYHFTQPIYFHRKNTLRSRRSFYSYEYDVARRKLFQVICKNAYKGKPKKAPNPGRRKKFIEKKSDSRKVECNVQAISWRERQIRASILIYADVQRVWKVLTDYESLAEFIPNLVCSKIISCPYADRIWLQQRGVQRALYWHIEAQVVLDLQEIPDLDSGKELHFSMVDGDFKKYEGKWVLQPGNNRKTTILHYEVSVIPRFNFPAIFVEKVIRTDLPLNLWALATRVEAEFATNLMPLPFERAMNNVEIEACRPLSYNKASFQKDPYKLIDAQPTTNWGAIGMVCRLDKHCMVDEVHLRRLDDLLEYGGVHRRVVATITIGASSRKVWNILTAYERLPEFVPNLAISKVISRRNNKVRLLQEGCKGLLYMVLHARVVLDLLEHHKHEIVFEQVEGDFDKFWGKWIIEKLGSHHTLLKYMVETKMQKNCLLAESMVEEVIYEDLPSNLCAIRDHAEKDVYSLNYSITDDGHQTLSNQRVPDNIVKKRNKKSEVTMDDINNKYFRQRPKVPGLQHDMEVLKSELCKFISEHGQEGFMPMRKQLREHGRVDLEKAIHHMGGFISVAKLMNLSLAYKYRKPKGYWESLENLKHEVSIFQKEWNMDPSYMPSRKTFERAGRFDLARAFEKWGGINEAARLLMLKIRHQRKVNVTEEDVEDESMPSQDLPCSNHIKVKSPQVTGSKDKWFIMPDESDPNWLS